MSGNIKKVACWQTESHLKNISPDLIRKNVYSQIDKRVSNNALNLMVVDMFRECVFYYDYYVNHIRKHKNSVEFKIFY